MDDEPGARWDVEVRRLKTRSGRHRTLPRLLHVGLPGGARLVIPLVGTVASSSSAGGPRDDALAADVVTRALDRSAEPGEQQVWLTRGGTLEAGDDDWRWRAGTTAARGRYGVAPGTFLVVTRHGWVELPSGERRTWTRMRATWQAPYGDDRGDPVRPDAVEGWPVTF